MDFSALNLCSLGTLSFGHTHSLLKRIYLHLQLQSHLTRARARIALFIIIVPLLVPLLQYFLYFISSTSPAKTTPGTIITNLQPPPIFAERKNTRYRRRAGRDYLLAT